LEFSLFVNWFNPRGNKRAGKKESVDIILMNCMNLSPTMQSQFWYTFISGVTPGPSAPNMTTILHLLKPLIDKLLNALKPNTIPTHKYPGGRAVQVQLLPLIGDMAATHKVAGFASHSAKNFCLWCHVTNNKINKLQLGQARTAAEVQQSLDLCLKSNTQKLCESIVQENGACYSELN
jgi:hypothetical protein